MGSNDSIRDIFFEECEDLLQALSEGLSAIAGGDHDPETVNAVFRAVHSVKGGAGAFGLSDLVGFAHSFETVLDRIRANELEPVDDLLKLLQKSGDILADLVEAARDETKADAHAVSAATDALEAVLGEGGSTEEEFVFETVSTDFDFDLDLGATDLATYTITFTPESQLYATGHEPIVLFRALSELGEVKVTSDVSRLPEFEFFDWEDSYLAWQIILVSEAPESAVQEIFEFVEGLCLLEISTEVSATLGEDGGLPDLGMFANEEGAMPPPPISDAKPEISQPAKGKTTGTPPAATSVNGTVEPKKEARATLRVDVERIDRLINAVGELIINQAVITQRVREMKASPSSELVRDLDDYKLLARDIQEGVMGLRTQPVKQLFQRMTRIARESADVAGKSAHLVIAGEETEVDKKVIEMLADPLTHMIRNAIDHGLETPEKRSAAGKAELGTVRLTACYKSGDVLIQITDDGAGLNRPRIRQIAVEKKLIAEEAELSDTEIDNLLFLPGFSTASTVTSLSGRGVGMDVVKTAITSLGGRISIASTPGKGSVFSILLPLTLAVLDGMVVRVGTETMVVPIASIEEAIRPERCDLSHLGTASVLFASRGEYVPVIDLSVQLGQPQRRVELEKQTLLLVQSNGTRVALAVDDVIDKRQVVIKSLAKNYRSITGISGATILGDGKVALIIDPDGIAENPLPLSDRSVVSQSTSVAGESDHAA